MQEATKMNDSSICMAQTVNVINDWEFCDICTYKENDDVNWKCIQCLQHLCERCKNAHIYGKITMEHRIISKEEKDDEAELLRMYKCETHTDKNVIMYCKDDKQLVCAECIEDDHQGHAFISLSKVADDIREKIKQMKEKRKFIKRNPCPLMEKYKARREILKAKREIENTLNAVTNEMIDEYDREYQAIGEEYMGFELDTSANLLCPDADSDATNLRDVEIIWRSKGILEPLEPLRKGEDGPDRNLSPVPVFNVQRFELREMMFHRLSRNTDWVPILRSGGSSEYAIAVACIYIGISTIAIWINLRHDFKMGRLDMLLPMGILSERNSGLAVDDNAVVSALIHDDIDYIHHRENGNHIIFLGPGTVKDGKLSFISEDGMTFDGNVLFTSIVRYLKEKALRFLDENIIDNEVFWQIVLSEVWNGQVNYLIKGFAGNNQLKNWNICSDSDACVLYWSKYTQAIQKSPDVTVSPYIILDIGGYIGVSTRIVHNDGMSAASSKSALCLGFLTIVNDLMNIFNRVAGKEACLQLSQYMTLDFMEDLGYKYCHRNGSDIPSYFPQLNDLMNGGLLRTSLEHTSYSEYFSVFRHILKIKRAFIDSQVKSIMENVCKHISEMLSMSEMSSASTILLFGKYCTAPVVKETLTKAFPGFSILIPEDLDYQHKIIAFGSALNGWHCTTQREYQAD